VRKLLTGTKQNIFAKVTGLAPLQEESEKNYPSDA